jgi:hypothetical protein
VYNKEHMEAILQHHTAELLDSTSSTLLIARIQQYKNGGS